MGDRGGGREPKGASLKKSKKNPGAAAARTKRVAKPVAAGVVFSQPPPVPGPEPFFDAGVALLSRQFDRDRDRVIARAKEEGKCCGVLVWFSDIEKQSAVVDLSKTSSGFVYCAVGIHPDNIDRTNKKSHEEWLEKVEELGRRPECLAILTGLNLAREVGTHFAQETLLKSSVAIGDKIKLPVIFHLSDSKSLERTLELLQSEELTGGDDGDDSQHKFLLHDPITCSNGDVRLIRGAVDAGFHFVVSAAGLTEGDEITRAKARECVQAIPLDRLIVCTNSPWRTPQNLPDPYLRTLRNEPANIESVMRAICDALNYGTSSAVMADDGSGGAINEASLTATVRANTLALFGLETIEVDLSKLGQTEEPAAAIKKDAAVDSVVESFKSAAIEGTNPSVAADTSVKSDASAEQSAISEKAFYGCIKCRTELFRAKQSFLHDLGAAKTVFRVGEEGLCKSTVFVKTKGGREFANPIQLSVRGNNVECTNCGYKIGKYYPGEALCSCGATVHGPVGKLNALKIDFFDGTVDAAELASRSRMEAEKAQEEAEFDDQEMQEQLKNAGGKVKKSKKMKSDNRGNFSSFRNKSFIPNASRTSKKNRDADDLVDSNQLEGVVSEGEGESEEEDSDN